jgi:hypothetical protein
MRTPLTLLAPKQRIGREEIMEMVSIIGDCEAF